MQTFVFGNLFQSRDLGDKDAVRVFESLRQLFLEHRPACGVGPRLENRPEPVPRKTVLQRLQRLSDRGRMMSEIVDHFYAPGFAPHFLATGDALKTFQGMVD